jgi:hypothetical protein
MIRKKVKELSAGVIVLLLVTFLAVWMFSKNIRRHDGTLYVQAEEITSLLHDGDVICRLGNRLWSLYFRDVSPTDKRFSHLGIVRIRDNSISVINAEGLAIEGKDFVNEVTLQDFLKIARAVGIFRIKNIDGKSISDTALEFKGRPFDWQFDLTEDNTLYCSELLYVVLKQVAPDIKIETVWQKELGKAIIPPEICSQSEDFVEIGYFGQ